MHNQVPTKEGEAYVLLKVYLPYKNEEDIRLAEFVALKFKQGDENTVSTKEEQFEFICEFINNENHLVLEVCDLATNNRFCAFYRSVLNDHLHNLANKFIWVVKRNSWIHCDTIPGIDIDFRFDALWTLQNDLIMRNVDHRACTYEFLNLDRGTAEPKSALKILRVDCNDHIYSNLFAILDNQNDPEFMNPHWNNARRMAEYLAFIEKLFLAITSPSPYANRLEILKECHEYFFHNFLLESERISDTKLVQGLAISISMIEKSVTDDEYEFSFDDIFFTQTLALPEAISHYARILEGNLEQTPSYLTVLNICHAIHNGTPLINVGGPFGLLPLINFVARDDELDIRLVVA